MTQNPFKPATKEQAKLRLAITGVSGSGKTYTALALATTLGKTAVIDTEHGSASKYADRFQFDTLELTDYAPARYVEAIRAAQVAGYEVVVIDSLSHAWNGRGGVLEIVDKATQRSKSKNAFTEGWSEATPQHNALIEAITSAGLHVIATMRSKTEYALETNAQGKALPRKIGMAPVQRDGMEYEFDITAEMDTDNNFIVSKSRCSALSGAVINKPNADVAEILKAWLTDGVEPAPRLTWKDNGDGAKTLDWLQKRGLDYASAAQLLNIAERDIPLFYTTAKGFCEAVVEAQRS